MNKLDPWPIKKIDVKNVKYPDALRKISEPPQSIYYRGGFLTNEKCFAIVGTRLASNYGKEIAFSFAKELAQAGLTIVSGMAKGIDTFSHQGALAVETGSLKTIAVLGTGLEEDVIYPQENLGLAKKILEQGGCLLSEYTPETHGDKFTFPKRNRLVSGLALGILVVEAKYKSGALITANYAQKQGKKVFAVPGSINSSNSKGPHSLIKKGAQLVDSPQDILKALNIEPSLFVPPAVSPLGETAGGTPKIIILQALSQGSLHIDQIIKQTQLPSQAVSSALTLLELESKVKNLSGNVFALIR